MLTREIGLRFVRGILIAALMLTFTGSAQAYFVPGNHQAATLVLGQANFTANGAAHTRTGMSSPSAVAIHPTTGQVFVAEPGSNRVLRFASASALANGAAAEAVLGQPDFTSHASATTQSGMYYPGGVFVDAGGRLWVADSENCRILRFDSAASKANGAQADGVLGQPDFTSKTLATIQSGMGFVPGVAVDAQGRLWVADSSNNRVLRFDRAASKANGAAADGVLGQTLFTTSAIATTRSGMYFPYRVSMDASGRLWVADANNNRVLRFDSAASKANGAQADGVLGQPDFTSNTAATTQSGMHFVPGVAVDAQGRLYAADWFNNRILVFNAAAGLANGANASYVLGQTDFTTGTANTGGISAATLHNPIGVSYDPKAKVLWAADNYNNRVLMYGKPSKYFYSRSAAAYDGWVLESGENTNAGGTRDSAATTFRLGDDAARKQYRGVLSFSTGAALPDNAVITKVTLKIRKFAVVGGGNPLNTFQGFMLDIKKGTFGTSALQNADFQTAPSHTYGPFTPALSGGWYTINLTSGAAYVNKLAGSGGLTQIRLRFKLDDNNNATANYLTLFSGDASSALRPQLIIVYYVP